MARRLAAFACLCSIATGVCAHPAPTALLDRAMALEQQSAAKPMLPDNVQIYVGNPLPDWSLIELSLRVEGQPERRYSYSPTENRALARGGLHLFSDLNLGNKPRRASLEYFIREQSSGRAVRPLRGRIELDLVAGSGASVLQLQERTLSDPELVLTGQIGASSATLRYSNFLELSGHPSRAAFLRGITLPVAATAYPTGPAFAAASTAATPAALLAAGEAEALTPLDWTLRDRSNLQLGYVQLRSGQPAAAAEAFRRVRSPGPYANAALLGYGWARMIPEKAPQAAAMFVGNAALRSQDEDALAETRRTTPFRYADAIAHDNRADDLRNALVPWGELIGRDPTDSAVQEGLLALAYAHGHLGAHAQAAQYFRRAVDQLDALIRHYDSARLDIESGGLARLWTTVTNADNGWPGWMEAMPEPRWWLTDPPNAPTTFYFDGLIADADFLRELDELLGVRELEELLQDQAQRLTGGPQEKNAQLRAECAQVSAGLQSSLRQRALHQLAVKHKLAEQYLAEASFSLARMVDRETAFNSETRP